MEVGVDEGRHIGGTADDGRFDGGDEERTTLRIGEMGRGQEGLAGEGRGRGARMTSQMGEKGSEGTGTAAGETGASREQGLEVGMAEDGRIDDHRDEETGGRSLRCEGCERKQKKSA